MTCVSKFILKTGEQHGEKLFKVHRVYKDAFLFLVADSVRVGVASVGERVGIVFILQNANTVLYPYII